MSHNREIASGIVISLVLIAIIGTVIYLTVKASPKKSNERYYYETTTPPQRTNDELDQCGIFTTTISKLYPGICEQMFKAPDNQKCINVVNATITTENDTKNDDVRFVTNKLWDVFSGYNQWCNESKPNETMFFEYIKTL